MKSIKLLSLLLVLTMAAACAQFGAKVETADGRIIPQEAFIAQQQFAAEATCYLSRKASVVSISKDASAAEAVAIAMGNVMSIMVAADTPCGSTNINDLRIAQSKARWGFGGALVRGVATGYGIGQLADFGTALANAKGTTYNTDLSGVRQSNGGTSTGSSGGDSDVSSEDLAAGAPSQGDTTSQGSEGISSNTINIGGNVAVAGDRAAAGQQALLNGDNALISSIVDSELKQSPTGENQEGLQNSNDVQDEGVGGFQDDDGNGNGVDF
jgi:hypothetical protein